MPYLEMVLILSGLIFIHELGHFLCGRWMKIPIAIFSLGFGPKVLSFNWQGTEYRLSAVPIGGYVLPAVEDEKEFYQISIGRRAIFTLGGPLANLVFALLAYGLWNALQGEVTFFGLLIKPWMQTGEKLLQLLALLATAFGHLDQLTGVIGLVHQGGGLLEQGSKNLLPLSLLLSLNLALMNLLPLPGLDGGKLLLMGIEKLSPRSLRWQLPITLAGLLLLVGVMLLLTVRDVQHLLLG